VIAAANTFLADLDVYLKLHPDTPDVASVGQEASRLQSSIQGGDIPSVQAITQSLKHRMEGLPEFREFESAQTEERQQEQVRALGEAVSLATRHRQFLQNQIARKVLSPTTPILATFLKEYESALRKPNLPTLTDLNDRLKKFVSENGLTQAYDEAMAEVERGPEQKPDEERKGETPTEPHITDRNRFLMEGALTDWVLLFNASGKAPHVAKNIRGEIVFEGQQAGACVLHSLGGKIERADVEDILASYKVETVLLDSAPCPETNLRNYDVLIALRGELLKQPQSYLAPLLGLIEDDTFQELKTLTSAEFENFKNKWKAEATNTETEIEAGTRPGYGLIKIDNGSAVICMTTADAEQPAQRALLNEQRKVLVRLFNTAPEVSSTTADAAFIAAQRGQCGAIYAGRSDLWEAIKGFRRDNIHYSVVPLWFEPKQVSDRADEIRRENDRLAQEEQNRERQKQEEAELAQRKAEAQAAQKETQEAELQSQHGPQARARAEEIATAIKLLADGKETWATSEFTKFTRWYRDSIADGWEYVALDDQVADYGTVDWKKSRRLEAEFANVFISMKNRLLGENKKFCWSLGLIFDAEFQMHRKPFFEEICENASEPSREWKQGQGFRSQWVVE
jgi:hypothetical protein